MLNTLEIGPYLGVTAPHFEVGDHNCMLRRLDDLIGERGLMLGFIGDIWQSASVRRVIWLQRHAGAILRCGYNLALLIRDEPHMLYGFYISSPTPLEFPLLADIRGDVHRQYNMARHPGLVVLDQQQVIRHKWLVPDERVWPRVHDMLEVLNNL